MSQPKQTAPPIITALYVLAAILPTGFVNHGGVGAMHPAATGAVASMPRGQLEMTYAMQRAEL